MKYAVIDENETIREFRAGDYVYKSGETGLLESGRAEVRPVEIDAEPVYDPSTHFIEPTYEVLPDKVLQHWTVVPRDPAVVAEEQRIASLQGESDVADLVNRLKTSTPTQINTWIDTNVTNIASARAVLKAIVKLLAFAIKRQL